MGDEEKGEYRSLLTQRGTQPESFPVQQADPKYDAMMCCPWWPCLPCGTAIMYSLMLVGIVLLSTVSLLAGILCCLPWACFYSYSWFWGCCPYYWKTDLYQKFIYLSYWGQHRGLPKPKANAEFMPVSGLKPKAKLKKVYVDYAVNLQVPLGTEDQFLEQYLNPSKREDFIEHKLPWLPETDRFDTASFREGEDCVQFAMTQLAHVYPHVYQEWEDKHSDTALTRFCFYGLGAHRVEAVTRDGRKMFVVRTNALAGLPVREPFEKYGGDAYFDENWHPVMIVDEGLSKLEEDSKKDPVITYPGQDGWIRAKFRFRSSLFTLVTLVDHLYGTHLQTANLFVTALREKMSADHPIRRFLTPFTYQTIAINDNAKWNLCAPRSMGPRCFAFTEKGMGLAFSSAPYLLKIGETVPPEEGGPFCGMSDYVKYINKTGVDTEYWRQVAELLIIYEQFLEDYIACYYATKEDFGNDPEVRAMAYQYFDQLEYSCPDSALRAPNRISTATDSISAYDTYHFYIKWLAGVMWTVTGGHEQFGAVECYAQDVSWTSFKWLPGSIVGTKTTATSQALLMSFTSTPMPKILGDEVDWTHLFPPGLPSSDPAATFKTFQQKLRKMAERCDKYNASASTRDFPECFPMYTQNPGVLETSLSV